MMSLEDKSPKAYWCSRILGHLRLGRIMHLGRSVQAGKHKIHLLTNQLYWLRILGWHNVTGDDLSLE